MVEGASQDFPLGRHFCFMGNNTDISEWATIGLIRKVESKWECMGFYMARVI